MRTTGSISTGKDWEETSSLSDDGKTSAFYPRHRAWWPISMAGLLSSSVIELNVFGTDTTMGQVKQNNRDQSGSSNQSNPELRHSLNQWFVTFELLRHTDLPMQRYCSSHHVVPFNVRSSSHVLFLNWTPINDITKSSAVTQDVWKRSLGRLLSTKQHGISTSWMNCRCHTSVKPQVQ